MYNSILSNVHHSDDKYVGYNSSYEYFKNDLGHYFRFTYHLIRFVENNSQILMKNTNIFDFCELSFLMPNKD